MFFQFFRRTVVATLMLTTAAASHAQVPETADAPPRPLAVDQVLYKGVVGNLLDAVPIDPERRVELQRANAVASSVFSGRSLATLLGVTNPIFLLGGLIWGVWSASRITPATQTVRAAPSATSKPTLALELQRPIARASGETTELKSTEDAALPPAADTGATAPITTATIAAPN